MLNAVTNRLPAAPQPRLLTPSEISTLVRTARRARRWSQEALAASAMVTPRTVQRIEAAEATDIQSRMGVARALGIPVEWLIEPQVWVTPDQADEEAERQRAEARRDHHLLPARQATGKRVMEGIAQAGAMASGQAASLAIAQETAGTWAALLDLVRDCLDAFDELSHADRLDLESTIDEHLAALSEAGVSVVLATRRGVWRSASAAPGFPVTALYLMAVVRGAEPSEVAIPKEGG